MAGWEEKERALGRLCLLQKLSLHLNTKVRVPPGTVVASSFSHGGAEGGALCARGWGGGHHIAATTKMVHSLRSVERNEAPVPAGFLGVSETGW